MVRTDHLFNAWLNPAFLCSVRRGQGRDQCSMFSYVHLARDMKHLSIASGDSLLVELSCPHCQEALHLELQLKQRESLATQSILLHPGLPALWLTLFLGQHLTSSDRLALFRTCKALANLVVKHCHQVTLRPAKCLQFKSKQPARAFVLGMAAGCNNIHLRIEHKEFVLDTPAIWECITQLTLDGVGLDRCTISRLRFSKLTRLTSMQVGMPGGASRSDMNPLKGALDIVRTIKQAGALPLLNTLHGDYSVLCMLAPVLGAQVTQLVLHQGRTLDQISSHWPALQRVELQQTWCSNKNLLPLLQNLFSHPTVKHVTLSGCLTDSFESHDSTVAAPQSWDSLEFTQYLTPGLLAAIPLQGVQQLRLPLHLVLNGVKDCEKFTAALHTMNDSSPIVLPSAKWADQCGTIPSASDHKQTVTLPFHPGLLDCLFSKCTQLPGALVLQGVDTGVVTRGPHLDALAQLPRTTHTLHAWKWGLEDGCSWMDVVARIPAHVRHLLIASSVITRASWDTVLNQPAPSGLRSLTLIRDNEHMSWVPWDGDELEAMQALVSAKWPFVRLEVDG